MTFRRSDSKEGCLKRARNSWQEKKREESPSETTVVVDFFFFLNIK